MPGRFRVSMGLQMGQMTKLERPVVRWIESGSRYYRGLVITLRPPDILEIRDKGAKYPSLKTYSLAKLGKLYVGMGEAVLIENLRPDPEPPVAGKRTKKGGSSVDRGTARRKKRVSSSGRSTARRKGRITDVGRLVTKKRVSSRAGRRSPKKAGRRGILTRVPGKGGPADSAKRRKKGR